MATFDEFYSSLDSDPGIRGKQFEKFVKWFLKNDPVWASQVKDIWLWDEHPKRSEWGRDCGIDLVFDDFQNKTWAVQAKGFAPISSIKKQDMDSFISESSDYRFQGRLLIASTDRIGNNADRLLNRHEVVRYLLNDFRNTQIIFPDSPKDLSKGKRKDLRKPRPHQLDAIIAVEEGLKTANRGQVLMACGTGKTLTSLWIKERLGVEEVLVLLPSLSLLSQTLKEWLANCQQPFKWICICHDQSIIKRHKTVDDWLSNTSEIGIPVTNNINEIKLFLNESNSKVIFSTYQSSPLIAQAQKEIFSHVFDLVISDEAHRCAGIVSPTFGCVLDSKKIKAKKRLFFTATPKILSNRIKRSANENNLEISSMDDAEVFGEILYQLKFSQAIKKNLLTDYKVIVMGVDNLMIREKIINRVLVTTDREEIFDAENMASKIGLIKGITNYQLKRIITFHSRIKGAKEFADNLEKIMPFIPKSELPKDNILCEHVSGSMKTADRNEKLQRLKHVPEGERRILSNAKCLSEGIDIPTLDCVAFIDSKSSQVDIIQAVGRAIRKSDDKSCGIILIPVYLGELNNAQEEIVKSRFENIWKVILALKSQDDTLMQTIDNLRMQMGTKNKIKISQDDLKKIYFDLPFQINSHFVDAIRTVLVENTSEDWMERYGQLKLLYDKNKHLKNNNEELNNWIYSARSQYKKGTLSKERIRLLDNLNFEWKLEQDENWFENYKLLEIFFESNGHSEPPISENMLHKWSKQQKYRYKDRRLSKEKIILLNKINFNWKHTINSFNKYLESDLQMLKSILFKEVAITFNVSKEDIVGRKRNKEVTIARATCAYFLNDALDLSSVQIGKLLGGRDHSTILNSLKTIKEEMNNDLKTKRLVQSISKNLNKMDQRFNTIIF